MNDMQTTRLSLLIRLQQGQNKYAWSDFAELYSPVIYGFARQRGLQDADAADLVQEVLRSVAKSIPTYDHEKGRFRSWLMAVVRHRLCEFWSDRNQEVAGSGDTRVRQHLEQQPSQEDEDAEQIWEQEYRRSVFRLAAARVRDEFTESTWQAFWQTTMEGKSTREVAQLLGISEGAVYIARSRMIARLKKQVQALED